MMKKEEEKCVVTNDDVEKWILSLSEQLPKQLQPITVKAAPVIGKVAAFAEKLIPVIEECYARYLTLWAKLKPYRPELLLPSILGLVMCFFGGSFLAIIAAVEAYRMCGYETTVVCVKSLIEDFHKIVEVNKKDDAVDADKDGVADVNQITTKELVHRKGMLFLKTVDPKKFQDAFSGIYMGFMAVVATLKLGCVKALTLGVIRHTLIFLL